MSPDEFLDWISSGPVPEDWMTRAPSLQAVEARFLERLGDHVELGDGVIVEWTVRGTAPETELLLRARTPRHGTLVFPRPWPLWDDPLGVDADILRAMLHEWFSGEAFVPVPIVPGGLYATPDEDDDGWFAGWRIVQATDDGAGVWTFRERFDRPPDAVDSSTLTRVALHDHLGGPMQVPADELRTWQLRPVTRR